MKGTRLERLGRIARQARATSFISLLFILFLALSLTVHAPGLLELDLRVTVWLQGFRSDRLDRAARGLTLLGNTVPLITLGLLAATLFFWTGRRWAMGLSALIPPLALLLNVLLKELVGRPRPDDGLVHVLLPPIGLSFPSGHAMAPAVFYGFLALMAWVHIASTPWRVACAVLMTFTVLGMGLSRVCLGVHWFSDVVGGWTGGLLLLTLLALFYRSVADGEVRTRPKAKAGL
jgi:undecaprenyl-diphosphatase